MNTTSFTNFAKSARHPSLKFSVSTRSIRSEIDLETYIKIFYIYLDPDQIHTVFGNTCFASGLYGGRPFDVRYALTDAHLEKLEKLQLSLSLTLTNHFFDPSVYRQSFALLERHHRPGNSVTVASDKLARQLRLDFPEYRLIASLVKNLDNRDKLVRALDLYDAAVVPMNKNDCDDFLESLPHKDRLILFGNAYCAYNCPARTCYVGISQVIQGKPCTSHCSQTTIPRKNLGMVYFDLAKLHGFGFSYFKLIPDKSEQAGKEAMIRSLPTRKPRPDPA